MDPGGSVGSVVAARAAKRGLGWLGKKPRFVDFQKAFATNLPTYMLPKLLLKLQVLLLLLVMRICRARSGQLRSGRGQLQGDAASRPHACGDDARGWPRGGWRGSGGRGSDLGGRVLAVLLVFTLGGRPARAESMKLTPCKIKFPSLTF